MSPDKEQQLMAIYPELFDPDNERNLVTMFGIECGDGWFDLLKDCIEAIKEELEINPWDSDDSPKIAQIKEKYGTLRFYMHSANDAIYDIIHIAEDKSAVTCEECGEPAELRCKGIWYSTRCDECFA